MNTFYNLRYNQRLKTKGIFDIIIIDITFDNKDIFRDKIENT